VNFAKRVMPRRNLLVPIQKYYGRVYALRSIETAMKTEVERLNGVETGGVLVGFHDTVLRAAVVIGASGPGPKAHHGPTTFNRDREYCQEFLDQYAKATNGVVDFVGEWHKHREPDPSPSPVDTRTYRALARDVSAHTTQPVVLIVGTVAKNQSGWRRLDSYVKTNAFLFRADGYVARKLQWLPDEAYADLLVDDADILINGPAVDLPARKRGRIIRFPWRRS
jgi:integrative and conjugative element protein (TIGR02256 family)